MQLNVGDTIFLPLNIPHTWIQLTDKGKLTYLVQPAGTMEEFFRKMSALTRPPTPEEAQKIHKAHGMKVVGPPLTL
jgi:quercetin 2,3-dioxygenase